MTVAAFAIAAALGSVVRLHVHRLGLGWRGTLGVNVAGAFGLGWLAATGGHDAMLIGGTAALGSLTTFSTFALEAAEAATWRERSAIVGLTVVAGIGAATAGYALGG